MAQPTKTTTQIAVDDSPIVALSVYSGQNFLQRTFQNLGPNSVWIGDVDVDDSGSTGGMRVLPGATWTDVSTKANWYGICASGQTATVAVYEETGAVGASPVAPSGIIGPSADGTDVTAVVNEILTTSPDISGTDAAQGLALALTGGDSSTSGNAGGAVTVTGGTPGATGVGGAVSIVGHAGGATSGTGGAANVTAGAGTNGNADGGNVVITPGAANGSGKAGLIRMVGNPIIRKQPTPATPTAAATLTIAQLLTGILSSTPDATGATHAYTLPTGTNMDTGGNFGTNDSFDWSITNLAAAAADTITITANTDHTIVGGPIVPSSHATTVADSSQLWRSVRTGSHVWVSYRIA